MATPYQTVAKAALINWNGLSEEEATKKINTESVSELESQVYALNSMKYAVVGLAKQINLSEEETIEFFEAVVNGPETATIFQTITEKSENLSKQQQLNILSTIHDGWVQDNSSEKTFQKKVQREQLRQYAPLELIGWNEVKSDLLFLTPILNSIGISVNEKTLEESYHQRVEEYLREENINTEEDMTALIAQGSLFYPALPSSLGERLKPVAEVVTTQIITNWQEKDPESLNILNQRQQTLTSSTKK